MKNIVKFASAILMLISTAAFANNKESVSNKDTSYKTKYLRFGSMGIPCGKDYFVAPSVNGGWLYKENRQGVDISTNFAGVNQNKKKAFSFTAPKIQYLTYLSDNKNNNTYLGLGGSFHGMYVREKVKKEREWGSYSSYKEISNYTGLAANTSVGYSHKLGKKMLASTQFSANIPTPLAIKAKGDTYKPSFELNLGFGF